MEQSILYDDVTVIQNEWEEETAVVNKRTLSPGNNEILRNIHDKNQLPP